MKKINHFLGKNFKKKTVLDKETAFYVFNKVIKNEYGIRGSEKIKPDFYKKGKLFLKISDSNWASEIWTNRESVIKKINNELNKDDIKEIKIKK